MKVLPFIGEKKNCSGCSACLSVCPRQCIRMIKDAEGFLYPEANEACVNCGLCESVCPIKNADKRNKTVYEQKGYAAATKDPDIWRRSSSGGAFSEICRAYGDSETVICGAEWNGLSVEHRCVLGVDNISALCKSKYVASDIGKSFKDIREYLSGGHKVVFCGTPCQVSGLKSSLEKDYPNLLTIDFICHGAGSPEVFLECIRNMEIQFGGKIACYEFRTKRKVYEMDYLQKIVVNDKPTYVEKDPYIQLFLSQHCLRPCCGENCKFRNSNREGDITIADFKGLGHVFPQLAGSKKNYSTIVFNTDKGKALIPTLKQSMEMYQCKTEDISRFNPLFCKQTCFSDKRDLFFKAFIENKKDAIIRYTRPAELYSPSFARKLWFLLPFTIRNMIWRLTH